MLGYWQIDNKKNTPVTKEGRIVGRLKGIDLQLVVFRKLLHFPEGSDCTCSVDALEIMIEDGRPANRHYPLQLSRRWHVETLQEKLGSIQNVCKAVD